MYCSRQEKKTIISSFYVFSLQKSSSEGFQMEQQMEIPYSLKQ